jgi:hypothetical protein
MCWRSPINVSTLPCLMRPWILSTTGLIVLVLACSGVAHAQAEELPQAAPEKTPAPEALQAAPPTTAPSVAPPTPPAPTSAAIERAHRWVLIPYFGFNLPVASAAKNYSAGFRLGGLVGWHVTPRFSINGEFTLDLMDGDADSSILRPHEHYLDFVLSPLLHFRSGRIVIGPRLGWFTNNRSLGYAGTLPEAHSGQGFVLGINAGGFAPVGTLQVGLLASASFRHFTTVDCGAYGCGGDYGLLTILSLSLAALF